MPMFRTPRGSGPFDMISALQKCVRRGDERLAMTYAVEVAESNATGFGMLMNRIAIIAHEDVGQANVFAGTFVMTCVPLMRELYRARKGEWRPVLANCIMLLCRGMKTRQADHCWVAHRAKVDGGEVPDPAAFLEGKPDRLGDDSYAAEAKRVRP